MVESSRSLLRSRYGVWFLGVLAFVDSALALPIATDPFLVAFILVDRTRTVLGVLVTTIGSVFGGVVAYLIAALFVDVFLSFLSPGAITSFQELAARLDEGTFIMAFFGALTPLPYALIALTTGAIKGNLLLFIIGSLLGRTTRYCIVGYFTYHYGQQAVQLITRNLLRITVTIVILVLFYLFFKMWV